LIFLATACHTMAGLSLGETSHEKYTYETYPVHGDKDSQKEIVEMEFIHSENGLTHLSRVRRSDGEEITRIEMKADGTFISALRETSSSAGQRVSTARIWTDGGKVYAEVNSRGNVTVQTYNVPKDRRLAVDASLLVLLRSFPYDENKDWHVFMIDFSQHSVSVLVRQSSVEKVFVPAGGFECYRMEVIVDLFLFHPTITYWISREMPHFLVKHQGKRGPFTPSYLTSLLSKEPGRSPVLPHGASSKEKATLP
jgi:hypothetical protein